LSVSSKSLILDCFIAKNPAISDSNDSNYVLEGDSVKNICERFGVTEPEHLIPIVDPVSPVRSFGLFVQDLQ